MNDTVGARIKRLREGKKLTLEQLAEHIGSSKSYMWELENKENARPSAAMIEKLARALRVTNDAIVLGVEPPDAQDRVFFREYQELGDSDKERLRKIMRALKD